MLNIIGNMPGIVAVTTGDETQATSQEEHFSGVFAMLALQMIAYFVEIKK